MVTPTHETLRPLARYTVLDLTIARAGPTAVRLLADWGADVIRIEPTPGPGARTFAGQRRGPDEQNLHRNKRSLCLDLKAPAGAQVLRRLVERADVVVENFRADVKHRLGLDYEQLRELNPRIILASISGFGQDGPYAERPGVDQVVQGLSGLMSITGEPGRGPVRAGIAVSDTAAGMFLGQGILLALLHREHTGVGQWVHTSLLESMLNKLDFQAARYTMCGEVPQQEGNKHPTLAPMGTFRSRDGLVNLAASSPRMWEGFCRALGADALESHPDYRTMPSRIAHRRQLDIDVEAVTSRFDTADLVERLNRNDVPCGPIYDIGQAFDDPQVRHLQMTCPAEHPELGTLNLLRSPINLSAFPHPAAFGSAGPDPGQHSREVLRQFGFDDAAIDRMMSEGTTA